MTFDECPNCERRHDAAVYLCSECKKFGCMAGTLGGYSGPYSGCWTDKECPHCGEKGTKTYVGRISD